MILTPNILGQHTISLLLKINTECACHNFTAQIDMYPHKGIDTLNYKVQEPNGIDVAYKSISI